ncbi:MerR family transcriptional regulator [Microlunatus parietis]|uniref:DNA-binding transcriptional MerR regulator n=1 Tax=Microlunatus parietis TaxID=682979 RepID=A0A7Y9LDL6_9ACTN|nr:MerR family transcriptional regulator [Microlunatus parietis]NYE72930.1 DNA-binding transcriptional MerR regulator [Microlunatus parietis]
MTAREPNHMQIGVVAELTELSIVTLRHYDEVGLVPPSARSEGGFRLYTDDDVQRLRTIRRMKPLGFTLDEMRELLAALDTLNDPAGATDRAGAVQILRRCLERTRESRAKLERQLGYADELEGVLTGHLETH